MARVGVPRARAGLRDRACLSYAGKLPRIPALAVEPAVGFRVIQELPPGRVPAQAAAVPVGQVAEDGNGHRAGADLHVGQGALAGADAVEPVAMVARDLSRWTSLPPR